MLGGLLLLLTALVGLFYLLNGAGGLEGGEAAYAAVLGALALVYLASLSDDYRGRARKALGHAGIWIGLALLLIAGYSFRGEISALMYRVAGEVAPPGMALTVEVDPEGERSVRLRRHPNGHFLARSEINGTTASLLVDTGASTVVLKPSDAQRAGIDTGNLSFTVAVQTANGTTFAAPVRLRKVSIGPIEMTDVEALVAQPGSLKESLLGMSFLRRLRSYEFSGDFLTLRG